MAKIRNGVSIRIHNDFFNIFENERRKYNQKIGVNVSQENFSHILAKSNLQFKLPEINNNFFPLDLTKRKRRKR